MSRSMPIFLDHHATTPVDPRVLTEMLPWFAERFGNASSRQHVRGREAADAVERARAEVAALVGAEPREVVFTSGATEADNLALKGVLHAAGRGSRLVTTEAEHRAVLDPARRLAREGFDTAILPVDRDARVDPQRLVDALALGATLVSVMTANNEVGTLSRIAEIAAVCRARGVPLHTDAAQAGALVRLDACDPAPDLVSLSAHKLYGPQGVGALVVRRSGRRIPIEPLLDGGGHEGRLRSGTLPVPLIVGFGAACRIARAEREPDAARIARLRDRLWERLRALVPDLVRNGHATETLPNNLHVSVPDVDGDALLAGLTDVACSSGAACSSADPEPSHVLRAMQVPDALRRASLRFGLGRGTTENEIDAAATHVAERIDALRRARRRGGAAQSG